MADECGETTDEGRADRSDVGLRIFDRILAETNLLRWLHAEAAHWRDVYEGYMEQAATLEQERDRLARALDRANASVEHLLKTRDSERSSRQAWAAEAVRQEMQLEKFREISLNGAALQSVLIVGIAGEHDNPPSNEQMERVLDLWGKYINRELTRHNWHPRATCGRGDACDQHGALFLHADGTPCWGCQICLEEEGEDCNAALESIGYVPPEGGEPE